MSIIFDKENNAFLLHTPNMTYAMEVTSLGYLRSTHWGGRVERACDLAPRLLCLREGLLTWRDRYPRGHEQQVAFEKQNEEIAPWSGYMFTEPGVKLQYSDGVRDVVLKYKGYNILADGEAETLIITLMDPNYAFEADLYYRIYKNRDLIDRWTVTRNTGAEPIMIESLQSAAWYAPPGKNYRLTHMGGKWSGEYQMESVMLTQSKIVLENKLGISNHEATPWYALDPAGSSTEEYGEVWFGTLQWSGNWKIAVEVNQYNQVCVVGGMHDFDFGWKLNAGEKLTSPVFTSGYSPSGFGAASRALHDYARDILLPRPHADDSKIPIIYNCWSVFEFDINSKQQIELAKTASEIGCEVFMVDDGWFSSRDDDTSGLGDWWCSPTKFPDGLTPLIDAVKGYGMKFGLWVEPEMVNEKSELFNQHPEWVIGFPTRERTTGRNQLVLNFGMQEVQDWCYEWMDRLLTENDIDWIKWDMNRYISEPGWMQMPLDQQREIWPRYVFGLYSVYERLRKKHPGVKYINCASGGGRADLGLSRYTDRLTLTDNGDGLDFQRLFWGYTQFMPPRLPGAGFNNAPYNSINRRSVPFRYRLARAFFGAMQVGSNFYRSDAEEIEQSAQAIAKYKKVRHLIAGGDLYRLVSPYDSPLMAMEFVSKIKNEALLLILTHSMQYYNLIPRIKLRGLDKSTIYDVEGFGEVSGAALMEYGLSFQFDADYDSRVIHIKAL